MLSPSASRRRLLAVLRLAFGGPANASAWNWWPLVVWAASAFLGVFGAQIPRLALSRSAWVAIFLGVTALILLRATYSLHARVYPDFPLHRVSFTRPIYITKDRESDNFLFFDMSYTNRTDTPVNLGIELFWTWDSMGPYRCTPITNSVGSVVFAEQPVAVAGHHTEPKITLAFSMATVSGVSQGEHLTAVLNPNVNLFIRLTDLVSDAVIDEPLRIDPLPTLASTQKET